MAEPGRLHEIAIVGAGPTASSVLERLVANASELLGDEPLRIHLIDPHRAGTGRVWRPDLDPLLWMNSLAEDVTMFTDISVRCAGPIKPGPSLFEWSQSISDADLAELADPSLAMEIRSVAGTSFPRRIVQSVYLDWFHRELLVSLPPHIEVVRHRATAIDLADEPDGRQRLTLDSDERPLVVDVAILTMGHLDAEPEPAGAAFAAFAADHSLAYVPPGHTAELDLSVLRPGADVLVLGFGQAFTDLLVLVTEGRGGRFVEHPGHRLTYEASGLEPVLHVGSRRGVPYRSKVDYRLQAAPAPLPRFLDDTAIAGLVSRPGQLDFNRDVYPLLAKEAAWAYYHELFAAHPERTTMPWAEFSDRFAGFEWGGDIHTLVADAIPDAVDHFDIARLDRPLEGLRFGSSGEFQTHLRSHIEGDVARRTNAGFSADLGAYLGLLISFGQLARIGASGRLTPRSRVDDLGTWWFSFFMYYASGPPPARLRQFLALADAGLLKFIGADTTISADPDSGQFVARSSSHPETVVASALVDARIATPSVSRSKDHLLRSLFERGEILEEVITDGGWSANTGKLVVTGSALQVAGSDGAGHPRRHALGVFTSRPAAGAFARPNTNAPAFRQNDHVARSVLSTLAGLPTPLHAKASAS